jgi:type IV pilus assembly protein PilV
MSTRSIPLPNASRRAQAGLSLVEVLVTVVLVSVGLLGIAGLQLTSVRNTNSAGQRFQATLLAEDIVERMRANRPQVIRGRYQLGVGAVVGSVGLAREDLLAWRTALAELPGGDGGIDFNGTEATVIVVWTDVSDANPEGTTAMELQIRTEL